MQLEAWRAIGFITRSVMATYANARSLRRACVATLPLRMPGMTMLGVVVSFPATRPEQLY